MSSVPFSFDQFWEKLGVILKEIKERDLVAELRLVTGNCGCFAIALSRLFQDIGDLYDINQGWHVVLKVGRKYIDGTGIYTKKELEKEWGNDNLKRAKIHNDQERVLRETSHCFEVEEMEEILVHLIDGESVEDYYVS